MTETSKTEVDEALEEVSSIISPVLSEDRQEFVESKAESFVDNLFVKTLDPFNLEGHLKTLRSVGAREAGSIAETTAKVSKKSTGTENEEAYVILQKVTKSLDKINDRLEPKANQFNDNWLGFGKEKKTEKYFRQFKSSQNEVNEIIKALLKSRDLTIRTSVYLGAEQESIQKNMNMYRDYLAFIDKVEQLSLKKLDDLNFQSKYPLISKKSLEDRLQETILQKQQQLLSNLSVAAQAYLSLGVLLKSSKELFSSIEMTRNTAVAALQIAMSLARSIANEQLTIASIEAVNENAMENVDHISKGVTSYDEILKGKEAEEELRVSFQKLKTQTAKLTKANEKNKVI